jgi:copper(I)-binding protein
MMESPQRPPRLGFVSNVSRRAVIACAAIGAGFVLSLVPLTAAAVCIVNVPWVRPAAKGEATEAFMEITSLEGVDLVGGRSAIAAHTVLLAPGAKVRPVDRLALPPGAPVILVPGSYRLQLYPINRTLRLGDWVPLVLITEAADGRREEIAVQAEVRRRSAVDDHLHGHRH